MISELYSNLGVFESISSNLDLISNHIDDLESEKKITADEAQKFEDAIEVINNAYLRCVVACSLSQNGSKFDIDTLKAQYLSVYEVCEAFDVSNLLSK